MSTSRSLLAAAFLGSAVATGLAVSVAQSADSTVQAVMMEQVQASTFSEKGVPVYDQASGTFRPAFGPGAVMKFKPLGGDPASADFNFTRLSTPFAAGTPPDEVMMWGYNLNAGGGPEKPGETAIGWSLEGHYEPDPGFQYTEAHLHYVTKQGQQQRPFTIRINKNNPQDVVMGLNGEVHFHNGDGSQETAILGPGGLWLNLAGGTQPIQMIDDGGTFQIRRPKGNGAIDLSQGFNYATLPGALAHKDYFAVMGGAMYFNGGRGGAVFIDGSGALIYVSPAGRRTTLAPG